MNKKNEIIIGKIFKDFRHKKGITQKTIADRLGVTPQMIQLYERGEARIPLSRLIDICDLIGVNITTFVRVVIKAIGENNAK